MKLKVIFREDEDGEKQQVDVVNEEGKVIGSVNTQAGCPEDNNCYRLGITSFVEAVATELGAEVEHETAGYGDE